MTDGWLIAAKAKKHEMQRLAALLADFAVQIMKFQEKSPRCDMRCVKGNKGVFLYIRMAEQVDVSRIAWVAPPAECAKV